MPERTESERTELTRSVRFEKTDILRMFPSFVWKAELARGVFQPMNAALIAALGEIGAPLSSLRPEQSWQSPHDLHERAPFRALIDCVQAAAQGALSYLKVSHAGILVSGCWANVNAPGAAHPEHSHPNNYLSGVYYVRTPPGADTIDFHDPRPQAGIVRPPVTALTAENTDEVVVRVTEGTLLLFPAWLCHSVDANASQELRISFSFNLMFRSYAETMARPLWEPGTRS
ncbi:2OG-Fe(II) oxygenase family protein [Dongia deserti]|uniref:2OG-Fe(II) oxygenase family protein n=1 Tax=Dongia deserti TaxID=2268030 RepID=UPI00254984C5|nr:2OG-Fe(II) oxygenase family protein [Dongia deserti]